MHESGKRNIERIINAAGNAANASSPPDGGRESRASEREGALKRDADINK